MTIPQKIMSHTNARLKLRDASTLILVKEQYNDVLVYLLKRNPKSSFMGGLYVFPGGVVNDTDRESDIWEPFIDMSPRQIKKKFCSSDFSKEEAMASGIAAIRETLEEAGILIADPKCVSSEILKRLSKDRFKKNRAPSWFRAEIRLENLILAFSKLFPWSHWITPQLVKKRFDTRFYIARIPDNQHCAVDNFEATDGIWISPVTALEKNLDGIIPLSPPTMVTLTQLLKFKTFTHLKTEMKKRTWKSPVSPRMIFTPEGPVILEPWDPSFNSQEGIDTKNVDRKVLSPGSRFSRIWCDKGIWKPISS